MSGLSRRTLLASSASALVSTSAVANSEASSADQPTQHRRALIDAHKAAYAEFMIAMHGRGSVAEVSRTEEVALLAICSFPAVTECDRAAKASYLLNIEARGELDLREHMQAVLKSML